MEARGQVNAYGCPLGHLTYTVNLSDGVTPFIIKCPYEGCTREAQSAFYKPPRTKSGMIDITHAWYRPRKDVDPDWLEHIMNGGLKISELEAALSLMLPPTEDPGCSDYERFMEWALKYYDPPIELRRVVEERRRMFK